MATDRIALANLDDVPSRRDRRLPRATADAVPHLPNCHRAVAYEAIVNRRVSSRLAAAEIRIAELEAALATARQLASHDPLTGAINRRGLDDAYAREAARAQRTGMPLSLALLDLDDFKSLNDTHGHAVGDAALVHLVRVISRVLRPSDICCRLGGEEFVVMMPGTDQAAAARALGRLQAAVAVSPVATTPVVLAFSAGLVQAVEGEVLHRLLCRADQAMYEAKAAGKGRIVPG